MKSRQLWIGFLVLAVSGSIAEAARTSRGKTAARPAVTTRRATRPAVGVRRARPAVATKRAPAAVTRMAKATPSRAVKRATPAARSRPTRWAQATPATPVAPSDTPATAPPTEGQAPAMAPVAIPQEAEPLMTRALAAYYVMGDESVRDLRARGWAYGDIATAGNIAARSRRPFAEIARGYEERRDWTLVARDVNLAPEQIYVATNSPRYVMIRPTPQEMERMQIARLEEAYQRTLDQYRQALAQAQPPTPDGRLAEASPAAPGTPEATTPALPPAAQTTPAAPDVAAPPAAPGTPQPVQPNANTVPSAVPTVDPTRITTNYESAVITPVEKVASARLELAPASSDALLRRAVAHYYALHPATIRDLEAQGWGMADVLVAGNLAHRSEATFDEVVALRQGGEEWRGIAERIGVAPEELHTPTMGRRVEAGDWMLLQEMKEGREGRSDRDRRERPRNGDVRERQPNGDTGERQPEHKDHER